MESLVEIRVSTRILRLRLSGISSYAAGLVLNDGFWEFEQMNKMVGTRKVVIVVFYGEVCCLARAQSTG